MSTLLLRLAGPMQSWGTRSRFSNRDTGLEPSRSGVVGLLCAALGHPREAALDEFGMDRLKMAVRVDREGRLVRDYHTAQEVLRASGKGTQDTVLSERFYLADADFLVGLQGEEGFLKRLATALSSPVWQLCLGRKAFVPALPVCEGLRGEDLYRAEGLTDLLKTWPWRKRLPYDPPAEQPLRCVLEVGYGEGEPRQDAPLSFVSPARRFAIRHVRTEFISRFPTIIEPEEDLPHVLEQSGS